LTVFNAQVSWPARAVAFVSAAALAMPLFAYEAFLREKQRGWFWREAQPLAEKEKMPEEPLAPPPAVVASPEPQATKEEAPPTFSVKWFQKHYMDLFEKTVDNPTAENMDQWRLATRVMIDKASNVAQVFRERAALDVELDEQNRYPIANAMRMDMGRQLLANQSSAIKFVGTKAALWVFLDEECSYCRLQYNIIKTFVKEHDLTVSYIVRQGKPIFEMSEDEEVLPDLGHSEALGIKLTPAVVMVAPPDKMVVLTQGMLAADALGERLLLAAKHEGILSEDRYAETNPNVAGLLSPKQINSLGALDFHGPGFAKKVREMLRENISQINASRMYRRPDAGA